LLISLIGQSQDSISQVQRYQCARYTAWIELNNLEKLEGYLLTADDFGIYYLDKTNVNNPLQSVFIPYKNVSVIKFRLNGKKGVGFLIGACVGLGIDLVTTSKYEDPLPHGTATGFLVNTLTKNVGGGILVGGLFGLALGSSKNKVEIFGNPQPSAEIMNKLIKYTLLLEL